MTLKNLVLLLLMIIIWGCDQKEPTIKPHIIYILADDLGWGDLGSYNADSRIPTPNMDHLATNGMRFYDMHSPSAVCTPTRYGILTGRYAWRSPLKKGVLWGYSQPLIEIERETVASLLQKNGYFTACVGKWHLGLPWQVENEEEKTLTGNRENTILSSPLGTGGPNDLGFDYFYGIPASLDMDPYCYIENNQPVAYPTDSVAAMNRSEKFDEGFWRSGPASPGFDFQQVLPHLTQKAVEIITENSGKEKPLFLYFPLTAPHTPWVPTEDYRNTSKAGKYGDFVKMVDDVVGQIVNVLKERDQLENTIIIVTSDNGSHMDHQDTNRYKHFSNSHWRGQKADIQEGGHRVPFIVHWPAKVKAGSLNNSTLCLTDFMATAAEIVGDTLSKGAGPDSYSFLSLMMNANEVNKRPPVIHHSLDGMFAIRKGDLKLIEGLGSGGFTKPQRIEPMDSMVTGQLYDLKDDPSEKENLFVRQPENVEIMKVLLQKIRDEEKKPL